MFTSSSFYAERKEQSRVKTAIVTKYFEAWANIIIATQKRYPERSEDKIGYIDLFAGPGVYDDGTPSTPVEVLKVAARHEAIRDRLIVLLNDCKAEFISQLGKEVNKLPEIRNLKYKPYFSVNDAGEEALQWLENQHIIPSLVFLDPWGYKGLTSRLIRASIKDWGSDCIFFFNFNRINMGVDNPKVQSHMEGLFGPKALTLLKRKLGPLFPEQRETQVLETLCQTVKSGTSPCFVLPFRFKDTEGTKTSHYVIFASKNFKGYDVMKHVMSAESSKREQGVASFEFSPVDSMLAQKQPLLFEYCRPLDDLAELLLQEYAGQSIRMKTLYENHSVGHRYIRSNYREVLLKLEDEELVEITEHKRNTLGDDKIITFPPKELHHGS